MSLTFYQSNLYCEKAILVRNKQGRNAEGTLKHFSCLQQTLPVFTLKGDKKMLKIRSKSGKN